MKKVLPGLLLLGAAGAFAQQPAPGRGELLYSAHCGECHTQQMHWRTLHRARDWDTLRAQVRRWQGEARLGWTEEDISAVAGYLNDTIYGFPRPDAQSRAGAVQWSAPASTAGQASSLPTIARAYR